MWLLPWSGSLSLLVFKFHWQQIKCEELTIFSFAGQSSNDNDQMFAYSNVLLKHELSSSQVFFYSRELTSINPGFDFGCMLATAAQNLEQLELELRTTLLGKMAGQVHQLSKTFVNL